ncbi:restriction endonuclease subunit S [Colwellia sp. 6_MG-2023]|uniref:restriction endonuclease subunit S n=1 Tax=Colwellia sp. 6_MG-2023 TaxID=3062676 RepID=UPI0026E2A9B1|nr:restriction endonuclease subunit S [Colwellia sp. 6_MG-2023]MDO6486267.1 restriction endonuclease subunit S [Colwellia sp. 6_MG-2023]
MSIKTLPKKWEKDTIGNLIESSNTGLVRGAKDQSSSKQFDYLKMNNLNTKGDFEISNLIKVDASDEEVNKFSLQYNDFIFNTRNSVELVGKCGVFLHRTEKKILFNNNLLRIRFHKIEPKIIAYWFNSAEGKYQLRNITSATTSVAAIYQKALVALDVPVPPLAEQKEIVKQLEGLLAKVDSIKNRLDSIPDIIKRFRQSVLASAVSGKLTEGVKTENIKNWKPIKLQDAANIIDPQPSHRTPKEVSGGIPYIGIGDLKPDGSIDFSRARKVSIDVLKEHNNRYQLKLGDFVFGKIGTLGKATVLPMDIDYTLSANVILIQPNLDVSNATYIMLFLSAPSTMDEIARQSNSTSQAAFGIKKMRNFACELPPVSEQNEIVRRVEQFFTFADKIEEKVNAAQERVNNLTQSILAKAFRGELTAEWRELNQALITGENSAEALLAKIQAERDALSKKKSPKKKPVKKQTTTRKAQD